MISFKQLRSNALSLGVETERAEKKKILLLLSLSSS